MKKILVTIFLIIVAAIIGSTNLEYILNGKTIENVVYRAGEVILSGDNQNVNYENTNDDYVFQNEGDLKVYFFSVGQADSILVTNGNENMLIDAGNNPDGKLIVEQLKNMNITKIDYLVGTHAHEDHIGGLDNVIKNFDVEKVFMPKKTTTTKTYEDVLNAVKEKKLKITAPQIGDVFYFRWSKM